MAFVIVTHTPKTMVVTIHHTVRDHLYLEKNMSTGPYKVLQVLQVATEQQGTMETLGRMEPRLLHNQMDYLETLE